MPSKPLAAKASDFNGNVVDDVASTVAHFTEDGFYSIFFQSIFSKILGFFYGDIVGLEGAFGLHSDQPWMRRVGKGDASEFNKAAQAQQAPQQAPAAPELARRMVPASL